MNGQWLGTYSGSNDGTIIVNIDERPSAYQGIAYLHDSNSIMPSMAAGFATNGKGQNIQCRTTWIAPINPKTGHLDTWENAKTHFSYNIAIPQYADITGGWTSESLSLSWHTNINTFGSCSLPKSQANQPSKLVAAEIDWETYKSSVSKLEAYKYVFRGQNEPWRLRTSFHRSGRAELSRFLSEDILALHKNLSSRTRHVFDLDKPSENGAFLNLVQHHGYPTPLLDWSYSPYVAAFFAFRGITKEEAENAPPNKKVRIYAFDQEQWKQNFSQSQLVHTPFPHLSIGEYLAIENERMIPQQAVTTITNIDDIESYLISRSKPENPYLWAIDIPANERSKAIHELRYMGITAGSLFPGLDGSCEELKERNF
ncbi:MAG: hypothetical protein H6R10_3056 [Rhodocyclaceae bacterium]|nr:hypothetical protein [Rhodocyclaceae bacterium]